MTQLVWTITVCIIYIWRLKSIRFRRKPEGEKKGHMLTFYLLTTEKKLSLSVHRLGLLCAEVAKETFSVSAWVKMQFPPQYKPVANQSHSVCRSAVAYPAEGCTLSSPNKTLWLEWLTKPHKGTSLVLCLLSELPDYFDLVVKVFFTHSFQMNKWRANEKLHAEFLLHKRIQYKPSGK